MPCRTAPPSWLALLLLLLASPLLVTTVAAAPPDRWAALPPGYEVVEVSWLLRAPDGALVRVRRDAAGNALQASERWDAPPRALPAIGPQGWFGDWLYRSPSKVSELGESVRQIWGIILRLMDYLGVVVLFAGAWVLYFLVRPALLGVPDRIAFLLAFAVVASLWCYGTQLYLSVAYALGLMLLPALALSLAAWLLRRLWWLIRGAPAQPAAS